MELLDIVVESFKYPLSDIKKSLILGTPYLILAILAIIMEFFAGGLLELTEEARAASPLTSGFTVSALLFFVVLIISSLIMMGISISVIKETIKGSSLLPEIELKENFINGLKTVAVSLVYFIIPMIILFIIIFILLVIFGDSSVIPIILSMLIGLVLGIFVGIISTVALGRLAETGSISEAIKFREIYETGKQIGLGKIFGVNIIITIILNIILSITGIFESVPVIGILVIFYIMTTYSILVVARATGLLYLERNVVNTYQNTFQQPYTAIDNNQQVNNYENYDFQPEKIENEKIDFTPKQNNDIPSDFKADDIINTDKNQNIENIAKKCDKCGYSNPEYVKICINCGKEL